MGQQINIEVIIENDYNIVPNKPLSGKHELSWDASGVWVRCIKNVSGWHLNWDTFEKLHGISKQRRIIALKELKKKKYCVEKSFMQGKVPCYVYYFSKLPMVDELVDYLEKTPYELIPKILDKETVQKILQILKSKSAYADLHKQICISTYYNNTNINKTNLNNTNFNNKSQASLGDGVNSSFSFNSNKHDIHDTCIQVLHDSAEGSTFSNEIDKTELNSSGASLTKLHNSSQTVTNPVSPSIKKKSSKTYKGTNAEGKLTKNKAEVLAAQPKQSLNDVMVEQMGIVAGNQTEDEKAVARQNTETKKQKAASDEIKMEFVKEGIRTKRKTKREGLIFRYIDADFQGELNKVLKDYFTFYISSGKPIQEVNYRYMIQDLEKFSGGDENKKLEIVKRSLTNCWMNFYALKENDKSSSSVKSATEVMKERISDEKPVTKSASELLKERLSKVK